MADRTSSSITIEAPKSAVMAVVADIGSYPQWADGLKKVEILSTDADGRAATARLTLEAGPIKDSYVLAYDWSDDGVAWQLDQAGTVVSGMTGSYALADALADRTEVTYELTVDVRIPMLGMLKRKAEKVIIDTALRGLKRRVEGSR